MKLFNCKVRVAGSMLNEVRKEQVTASEIVLLRALHGDDAVIDVVHTANVNRSARKERERLARMYSKNDPHQRLTGADLVRKFLGIESQELPDDPPELSKADPTPTVYEPEEEEEIVMVDAPPSNIRRTRVERNRAAELTA